ncbi:retropepsin-like aspartic protease family protein [Yoonia litorea]|uniref:Aspartyl protease family protein n=1 Tax=Yoonia litorea TaxID=1123755 RepID=A0A1I6M051_9RHOB|nr:TIGR02281 family clan AA aspartic protease [Yoonia litorea]SFS09067.1 aspartyl protease family protein [Yoonia litorea]
METDQFMQLTYLVLLGLAIAGSAIVAGRNNLGKMAQQAVVWALIFVGVIAAYGLWDDVRNDVAPRQAVIEGGTIGVPRSPDGHYHLTLDINGEPVRFVVDTGATQMVLSQRDAARIGLDPASLDYVGRAFTANGEVRTAPVILSEVSLEGITDRGVQAVVNGGAMDSSLLGMSYLRLWDRIEIADNQLVLQR